MIEKLKYEEWRLIYFRDSFYGILVCRPRSSPHSVGGRGKTPERKRTNGSEKRTLTT